MTAAEIKNDAERAYAESLDAIGVPWVHHPRFFRFAGTRYTPDFYLPVQDTYIEIIGSIGRIRLIQPRLATFRSHWPSINLQVLDCAGQPCTPDRRRLPTCKYRADFRSPFA